MTRFIRRAWYRRQLRRMAGPRVLRAFADAYPDAFFVEIGSNDGEQHDHLRPLHPRRPVARGHGRAGAVRLRAAARETTRTSTAWRWRTRRSPTATASCRSSTCASRARASARRCRTGTTGSARSPARRSLSHAPHIPDIESGIVDDEVPRADLRVAVPHSTASSSVDLLADRHRGLRLGDPREHRPRAPAPAARRSTSTTTCRRRSARACAAHLEAGYETMEEGFDTFCLQPARTTADRARGAGFDPPCARRSPYEERAMRRPRGGRSRTPVTGRRGPTRSTPEPTRTAATSTTLHDESVPLPPGARGASCRADNPRLRGAARGLRRARPAGRGRRRAGARARRRLPRPALVPRRDADHLALPRAARGSRG